jgi:hypothetical protein
VKERDRIAAVVGELFEPDEEPKAESAVLVVSSVPSATAPNGYELRANMTFMLPKQPLRSFGPSPYKRFICTYAGVGLRIPEDCERLTNDAIVLAPGHLVGCCKACREREGMTYPVECYPCP